jgi:hypothetical protein
MALGWYLEGERILTFARQTRGQALESCATRRGVPHNRRQSSPLLKLLRSVWLKHNRLDALGVDLHAKLAVARATQDLHAARLLQEREGRCTVNKNGAGSACVFSRTNRPKETNAAKLLFVSSESCQIRFCRSQINTRSLRLGRSAGGMRWVNFRPLHSRLTLCFAFQQPADAPRFGPRLRWRVRSRGGRPMSPHECAHTFYRNTSQTR